ncbi:MFS general substrate transporter [Aspergillus brunneoviolaceus CBS 621.78]|uniref:MFS general substrate transporter n=1 Tax=Aspergillus brunneoviolaceus CBS 621.78 TaxID=1450534 RepID=A0ACD1GJH2_9EURO|nr:MFS general substrate transporter [Aspergillus brunneoviolaceus CBS 621.78]RAH49312.1 MFS general substrate transporter [Aspergillus brunneoviolaceus CBS 621.78]
MDHEPTPEPKHRMDGGLTAWLQVLGSWLIFANTWSVTSSPHCFRAKLTSKGLTSSYGVFETHYTTALLADYTPSAIAWIGSVQLFLMMAIGLPVGSIMDRGHLRLLVVAGSVLQVAGMLMVSLCTAYWQVFLAQGICVGIGSGLLVVPSVAVLPLYFSAKRMLATGFAATGSSLAGIIYSIMLRRLIVRIGFPWAVRVLALVMLAGSITCAAVMRLRPGHAKRAPLQWRKFTSDSCLVSFTAAFTAMMAAVYIPFFYVEDYALDLSIDQDTSFYLLSIMNATSLIGRIGSNWLADRWGGLPLALPGCLATAIILFFWRFATTLPALVVIVAIYGLVSGSIVSLPPAIIANLPGEVSEVGARIGVAYTVAAVGALVGNPIAGAARQSGTGVPVQVEYQGMWVFGAAGMAVAAGLVGWTLWLRGVPGK